MADADFTIADVLKWARTKPADERYDYVGDHGPCALEQFLTETGRATAPDVDPFRWRDDAGKRLRYSADLDTAACGCGDDDWTFGKFVDRLESVSA